MPYAENNGVRIYYEVMGTDGPPLVLQHGFTQTLETWKREGYVEKLESEYRLILIDDLRDNVGAERKLTLFDGKVHVSNSTIKALGVHEWHGQLHTSAGLKNWVIV